MMDVEASKTICSLIYIMSAAAAAVGCCVKFVGVVEVFPSLVFFLSAFFPILLSCFFQSFFFLLVHRQ